MEKKHNIEFIDSKIEREEITGFSFKSIIDGSLLTVRSVVKQIPFILFLVLLALIYIANRYQAEKMIRQIDSLKTEVKDLRAEEITTASELMNLNRPSNVQKLIEEKQLGLTISDEPPYKIVKKKR
jgi:cell division protein FtsB